MLFEHDANLEDPVELYVVSILCEIRRDILAKAAGVDRVTITRIRNRQTRPRRQLRLALIREAEAWARARLIEQGERPAHGDLAACAQYVTGRQAAISDDDDDR